MKKLFVFTYSIDPADYSQEKCVTYPVMAESWEEALSLANDQYPNYVLCAAGESGDIDEEDLKLQEEIEQQQANFLRDYSKSYFYSGYNKNSSVNSLTALDRFADYLFCHRNIVSSKHLSTCGAGKIGGPAGFFSAVEEDGEISSNNRLIHINDLGARLSDEVAVGIGRVGAAGCSVYGIDMYHGGMSFDQTCSNRLLRVENQVALSQEETVASKKINHSAAASIDSGIFYGGIDAQYNIVNECFRLSNQGSVIGSETTLGTARMSVASAYIGNNAVFFAGSRYNGTVNTVTRINDFGSLIDQETIISKVNSRAGAAGARSAGCGIFYSGLYAEEIQKDIIRLNESGVCLDIKPTITDEKYGAGGAGI